MTALPKRRLGRSPVEVTVLGMGGAPMAGLAEGPGERQSADTIAAAHAAGIRYFDTAPLYGVGRSEWRLGRGLGEIAANDCVVSTKVGRYLTPAPARGFRAFDANLDYGYEATLRAFDQSIQRLGVSRIDVLLIHDVDIWTHGTRAAYEQRFREAMEGAYRAVDRLRSEKAVAAIGIGVNEIEPCLRFARAGDFDCFMLAGRYTLLEQERHDELFSLLQEKNVSLLIAGPYNSGILVTGAASGATHNYRPAPPELIRRVAEIKRVCARHGTPLAACALQFPLAQPAVAAVVPGAVSAGEAGRNAEFINTPVPPALWAELKERGLIRAEARTPVQPANAAANRAS